MADSPIQDLPRAEHVLNSDLFVLEQSGAAMSLTGQVLIEELADKLDANGLISTISYTAPVPPSLTGTLTITTVNNYSYSYSVINGRGISGLSWSASGTSGNGQYHTGTFSYNDGTTSTVQIRDGLKGDTGAQTYVHLRWANVYPQSNSDILPANTVGPYIGIATSTSSTAPTEYTSYNWYKYKGETGATGAYVSSVTKTNTNGLVDTYTMGLSDGNTAGAFNVTNAKSIVSLVLISGNHAAGTTDVYRLTYNTGDTLDISVYNGANGLGSVSTVSGIQADGNGDVPQVISGNGAPTTATVGQANQLYFDKANSTMYYCAGESGGTYVWQGTSVTVDSAMSTSSTNPLQNKVITGKVGTTALNTTATDLSSAVNEVLAAIPAASTTTPSADGTGAAGNGITWARSNHVHPLNVATSGAPADLGTASNGTATTYARSDHVHSRNGVVASDGSTAAIWTTGDLNDFITGNVVATGTDVSNCPSAAWWFIVSAGDPTTRVQIAYPLFPVDGLPKRRYQASSSWSSWLNLPVADVGSITTSTTWTTQTSDYTQTVTVSGATVTSNSKVDLQPDTTALTQMLSDGCTALYVENNAGTLTLHALGAALTAALTIQCTVTEVS